jgi:hypothetical protein
MNDIELPDPLEWYREANRTAAELIRARKPVAAEIILKRALAVHPQYYELWANLSTAIWTQRRYEEARDAATRALEIAPDSHLAHANMGLICEGLGQFEAAEAHFQKALADSPDYLTARWDYSLLRLGHGDYKRGFEEYDFRIAHQRERDGNKTYGRFALPEWQGEDLAGKSIHIEAEQGVGDTLFFARFLPWLASKAARVTVCLSHLVTPLLWGYREIVEFMPMATPLPNVDYHAFIGSIPRFYFRENDAIPLDPGYIRKRIDPCTHFRIPEPGARPAFKIGIAWTGNPNQERNDERTIPLRQLLRVAEDPRVWLYGLQVGSPCRELYELGATEIVCDLSSELEEHGFVGTGVAIEQCDLVITCCTSTAHIAGALGKPCWVLLCKDPYWIWGYSDSTTSPWYPNIRLFRQKKAGEWSPVITEVKLALTETIGELRS